MTGKGRGKPAPDACEACEACEAWEACDACEPWAASVSPGRPGDWRTNAPGRFATGPWAETATIRIFACSTNWRTDGAGACESCDRSAPAAIAPTPNFLSSRRYSLSDMARPPKLGSVSVEGSASASICLPPATLDVKIIHTASAGASKARCVQSTHPALATQTRSAKLRCSAKSRVAHSPKSGLFPFPVPGLPARPLWRVPRPARPASLAGSRFPLLLPSALVTPLPALAYKNSAYRAIVSPCSALTYKNGCPQVSGAPFPSAYSVSFDTAKGY
jgi:hypothetical protein